MAKQLQKVELGDRAKDTISGFQGVVTAEYNYLNGCRRLQLNPETLHEGKPIDGFVFDEAQVEVVKKAVKPLFTSATAKPGVSLPDSGPGGDRPNPPSRSAPVR